MPVLSALSAPQRVRRVGHKGADGITPGNTLESFDTALALGADMIEFDVLSEHRDGSGELRLAHDYEALRSRPCPTLEQALAHLASPAFQSVELDVDLKLPGYELRAIDALAAHGLLERSLISSMYRQSLALLRRERPGVRLGWSVPRLRRDYTTDALTAIPALAVLTGYRRIFPRHAAAALRRHECDAIMAHWRLITRRLVRAVRDAGGELYVWTVDDRERIAELESLGVTGIITNDPRLFEGSA